MFKTIAMTMMTAGAVVATTNSEIGRSIVGIAAEHVPGLCAIKALNVPSEACARRELRRLDALAGRSVTVADELDVQRRAVDIEREALERKLQKNLLFTRELKQLCANGSCRNGAVWRNRRFATARDVDMQIDVLQREEAQIRSGIDRLRRLSPTCKSTLPRSPKYVRRRSLSGRFWRTR
jgi:hypothetical protein